MPDSLTLSRACRKPPLFKGDLFLYTLTSLNPQILALLSSHSRERHLRPSSLLWDFHGRRKTLCLWHFSTQQEIATCRISAFEKMTLKLSTLSVKVLYTNTANTLLRKQGTHSRLPIPGPRGTRVPPFLPFSVNVLGDELRAKKFSSLSRQDPLSVFAFVSGFRGDCTDRLRERGGEAT